MNKNTLEKGTVRVMIFKEGGSWFGVALEFNIVEVGDDPREVFMLLDEAIRGYVKSAHKAHLDADVLNQQADPEYERLWHALESKHAIPTPIQQVHSFGERILAVA